MSPWLYLQALTFHRHPNHSGSSPCWSSLMAAELAEHSICTYLMSAVLEGEDASKWKLPCIQMCSSKLRLVSSTSSWAVTATPGCWGTLGRGCGVLLYSLLCAWERWAEGSRNGVCLQTGLLEKWAAKGEVWAELILSLGLIPDSDGSRFWEFCLVHVCMRSKCGFPFTFAGRWLWNSMVKKQSCFLSILRTFASVFYGCWLRVNETWKNSQYGFYPGTILGISTQK